MSESYDFFMQMDMGPYVGEWVAICDKKVVSHSQSFNKAYAKAKKVCGPSKPFLALVPKNATMIL